jgi:hypothetical protein
MSGAATSRRIHETINEIPKRPQYPNLADRLVMPEATEEQRPHVNEAQQEAKQDISDDLSV